MLLTRRKRGYMVDMHCHILPGIDDGSDHMDRTIKMLEIAESEGIEFIIATPHYKNFQRSASPETILRLTERVQRISDEEGFAISIFPGNEIYYFEGVDRLLEKGHVLSLNQTNRVLVEFSPSETFQYIRNGLDSIANIGYVPVLAHVERYQSLVRNQSYVEELRHMDTEIQINAGSVTGRLGHEIQHFLLQLLDKHLVDYVGTDAHNTGSRAPVFQSCYQYLSRRLEEAYLEDIFYNNAMALVEA